MVFIKNIVTFIILFTSLSVKASSEDGMLPEIAPKAIFITQDGDTESDNFSGSAPVTARFYACPLNEEGWQAHYEWRFIDEKTHDTFLVRYEEDTEYTFVKSGSTQVLLYATFTREDEKVEYTDEYWTDATPIIVSISESKLDFPNAFSPNGDGINDIFRAKQGFQSIVEFNAAIYSRWGEKLYEWSDPAEGWDGNAHGKKAPDGTYFLNVKAVGADGIRYKFKKDVNLLRGYNEENSSGTKE